MNLQIQKIASFKAAFVWGIFVTVLSVIPGDQFPHFEWGDFFSIDKIFHLSFYGLLTWLTLCRGIWFDGNLFFYKNRWWIGLACAMYGLLLEFVQRYYCIGRSFDVSDEVANAVGAFLGAFLYGYLYKKKVIST
ncbi:MAG: hypothetical protein RL757_1922 [Bacteroidota bacterium]|jgi:hypothetical protein